jgi:uncharacterized membrane protein YgdD (TMEM256/DUF423 family)
MATTTAAASITTGGDPLGFLLPSAAFLGTTGVGAGACGAHALKSTLEQQKNGVENWKTAVIYQLIHAVALLALSALSSSSCCFVPASLSGGAGGGGQKNLVQVCERAGKWILAGVTLFSGSIYCLVLDIGNKKIVGPLTPVGGLLMMGGWAMLLTISRGM